MSLSPETQASYIPIIDSILAASDLETISEKRIRKGLQAAVKYDITPQKDAIKALIMARFDAFTESAAAPQMNGHTPASAITSNGVGSSSTPNELPAPKSPTSKKRPPEESDSVYSPKDSPAPAPKKKKTEVDSDAAFAAKLQAQENSRARATRGGGVTKKAAPAKKKSPKKKTASKVKAEDDSDLDGSDTEVKEKKVNRSGGFHKELLLSPPLSALLNNEIKLSRPQTVKRIWEYIHERDLQDPDDKRMIRCDDNMRAVFKADKIHMFTMNKILSQNLYNPDE